MLSRLRLVETRRLASLSAALAMFAAIAMGIVTGTACPGYPTPSDSLWGHAMPSPANAITLVLTVASAIFFATAATLVVRRQRVLAALTVFLTSGVALFFVSVLIWRLSCPASAGNGG